MQGIRLPNCKECNVSLDSVKRQGNLCMGCHTVRVEESKKEKRLKVVEAHGNKCADCGGTFHPCQYDFHHIDPSTKVAGVTQLCQNGRKMETILAEAAKCVLLCANCHRLRHFK